MNGERGEIKERKRRDRGEISIYPRSISPLSLLYLSLSPSISIHLSPLYLSSIPALSLLSLSLSVYLHPSFPALSLLYLLHL